MSPARSLLWSLFCQTVGFVAGMAVGAEWGLMGSSAIHAIVSILCARFMRLPRAWIVFNAFLPIGIAVSAGETVPNWALAAGAVVLFLLFVPTLESGVPLYLSSRPIYDEVASFLPTDRSFSFIDLGCGTAGLLIYLVRRFPNGRFVGIELAPIPYLISWLRARVFGKGRVQILFGSMWKLNLSPFDIVYTFLAPPPMAEIWNKVKSESKTGTVLLSNSFEVPGVKGEERPVSGPLQRSLFVYRF